MLRQMRYPLISVDRQYATQIRLEIHYNVSQKMTEITQNRIYCHAKKDKTYQKNGHI